MTDSERREAARQFYNKWAGRGKEDEDDRSYWIDFLQNVMGVDHVTDRIDFQKKVIGPDGNTKRIDAYIPETHVLIEQKSLGIDLSKPQAGHDGMTPYEQAKMYDNSLPVSEKAKWIIVSNFAEIWIYDMDTRVPEPMKLALADIQTKYSLFEFIVNQKEQKITQEMEISVKAGEFVGLMYDALLKQYIDPTNENSLRSLNMLCVRLVFCLYAEDALIFGENGHMFHDYLEQYDVKDMRKALIELFKILDTPEDKRDPYDTSDLSKFPYVNGGLFADEAIEIPNFTEEIKTILLSEASEGFDWSMISPTIFGAVFESTLNPETRRSGGMHYTSIENIHKVIDPLFLDDLNAEFNEILSNQVVKTRNLKLKAFQDKLASLTWLDPACGSGNFLTETYISIRRLENEVIKTLKGGQMEFISNLDFSPIKVGINQFYGIEINDFAVTVAKTALWIAESQMMKETEDILLMHIDFLPLKTNASICEGNAILIDWNEIVPKRALNYIMGNPPFIGGMYMSQEQKDTTRKLFTDVNGAGEFDYVCCWYKKALDYMNETTIKAAFVSTNSISQGESVLNFWKYLYENYHYSIIFAYTSFIWDSEANAKAKVHCVIIGFQTGVFSNGRKRIYSEDGLVRECNNINAYLLEGDDFFVDTRSTPICSVPAMRFGSMPRDGGGFILSAEERAELIKNEPIAEKWIKPYIGAAEFLNNKERYCLWLVGAEPSDIQRCPTVKKRIEQIKEFRASSKAAGTRKFAATPTLFCQIAQPDSDYIMVPETSSGKRRYIPMGFQTKDVIASNLVFLIPDANMYDFGVLMSNVHNAWMRLLAGRLKSDYRYSKDIVYNTFPWPTPTDEQKAKIEQTAKGILDARALFPDSSLADLYDPIIMPPELQKAHASNDRAVMQAYGFSVRDTSESDCVAALLKRYQEITASKEM